MTDERWARPDGYPYGEFDAAKWAAEFDRIYPPEKLRPDIGTMLGWFANAIMTGYDKAKNEAAEAAALADRDALREAAERVIREYDKTNLTHDTMYEDVATEIDWLRIALDPQHPMYGQVESEARIRAELRALDSEDVT